MDDLPVHSPVFLIEVDKIAPNPQQPRKHFEENALSELANSIREFGILQPLTVTKLETETETGTQVTYQLIAGERRWLASKQLGLERVPAIIRSVDLDRERLELAVIENVQRADLDPIETARAYAKLQDQFGLTQREIATRIGKSREGVANALRLLNLPSQIQDAISQGHLGESQARLLLTVTNPEQQLALFQDITSHNLSVRGLKSRIERLNKGGEEESAPRPQVPVVSPEVLALQRTLEESLGAKVKVESSQSGGKLTISFFSPEELYGIVKKLIDEHTSDVVPEFPQETVSFETTPVPPAPPTPEPPTPPLEPQPYSPQPDDLTSSV